MSSYPLAQAASSNGLESWNHNILSFDLDGLESAAEDPSRPVLYKIYRATTPGGQSFLTPTATTYRTDFCDTTAVPATSYCYVVRAQDYSTNEEANVVEWCDQAM